MCGAYSSFTQTNSGIRTGTNAPSRGKHQDPFFTWPRGFVVNTKQVNTKHTVSCKLWKFKGTSEYMIQENMVNTSIGWILYQLTLASKHLGVFLVRVQRKCKETPKEGITTIPFNLPVWQYSQLKTITCHKYESAIYCAKISYISLIFYLISINLIKGS